MLKHLSEEWTEGGIAVLVAGLDCDDISNVFVFVIRGVVFPFPICFCLSVVDGLQQTNIGRHGDIL